MQAQQDAGVISADTAELILRRAAVIKDDLGAGRWRSHREGRLPAVIIVFPLSERVARRRRHGHRLRPDHARSPRRDRGGRRGALPRLRSHLVRRDRGAESDGAVARRPLRGRRPSPRGLRAHDRGDPRACAGGEARLRGVLRTPGRLRPALARCDRPRPRRGIRRRDASRRLRRGLPRCRPRRRSRGERHAELRGGRLPAPPPGDRADDRARALADRRRWRAHALGTRYRTRAGRARGALARASIRPATRRWSTKRRPIPESRRSSATLRLDELDADAVTPASTLYVPPVPR